MYKPPALPFLSAWGAWAEIPCWVGNGMDDLDFPELMFWDRTPGKSLLPQEECPWMGLPGCFRTLALVWVIAITCTYRAFSTGGWADAASSGLRGRSWTISGQRPPEQRLTYMFILEWSSWTGPGDRLSCQLCSLVTRNWTCRGNWREAGIYWKDMEEFRDSKESQRANLKTTEQGSN